ncbi:methyltransferase domain-containing protein [Candidatus Pelagibacter sp.]|nr:methyltransferase domain-containing protein [Candidatus Pelagibacter sp.]
MSKKLSSGDKIFKNSSDWSFKGEVYKNFDSHISKSVPLYQETHDLYLKLSDFFLQEDGKIVDIGCSTGTFVSKVYDRHKNNHKKLSFVGIDNTMEMVKYCKKKYALKKKIQFLNKDINKYKFKKCCIITSFYTIQFVSPKKRQTLIDKVYKGLNWGGAFFFIEKIRGNDARFQDILSQVYLEYKLSKGYTPTEIINKSKSLKGILEPFSTKGNVDLLKRAGFKDIITVMKYGCFEGFLAIK